MPKPLDDKLMLTDVITHLKDIMTLCGTAMKESNCENMRTMITKISEKVAQNQFAVFSYMNSAGMYPIDNAEPKKVKQTIEMFSEI